MGIIFLLVGQTQASQFYKKGGEVYDFWGICRTRAQGEDGYFQIMPSGFRPVIVFESLGKSDSLACQWGKEFLKKIPEDSSRAKWIFEFVKNKVNYTSDLEQFGYREFAQNADELAYSIKEGKARGDCEDYAILLATLYKMAGYRSAIALIPGHTAALVYLPGYTRSNVSMQVGGKNGWLWVEATGKNNYFGWAPPKVFTSSVFAYELKEIEDVSAVVEPGGERVEVKRKGYKIPSFLSLLFILWIFPLLVRFLRTFLR